MAYCLSILLILSKNLIFFERFENGNGNKDKEAGEGLTQTELSKLVGIPQRHISEMENGKRPIVKEMAKRLGKALNISYKVFL